jgi:hypothetical protein
MRPSESIRDAEAAWLESSFRSLENRSALVPLRFILAHLDAEAERRAKFEADVLERLAKLEALNPEVRTVIGSTTGGCTVHGLRPVARACGCCGKPVDPLTSWIFLGVAVCSKECFDALDARKVTK